MTTAPETHAAAQSVPIIETVRELDQIKVQQFQTTLHREQNISLGILAGVGAALLGACLWAAFTLLTGYQIGVVGIGVGLLVGWALRTFGKGIDSIFGYLGAGIALVGCVLGNLLMLAVVIARQESVVLLDVLFFLAGNPAVGSELLRTTFSPIDLLFYGFALYYGYKHSFRRVTQAEQDALYQTRVINPPQ